MVDTGITQRSHRELGLDDPEAVELLRLMLLTRAIDERIWALNRQGKVGITAPCKGQEAAQVGCARAFTLGRDVFLPYYRDLGVLVTLGYTAEQLLQDALGKATAPFTAGRQMPFHWTSRELRILSPSSAVATQIPHAVGAALACRLRGEQAVTLVTFGDGATSKGDFHESLNMASIWKLPVIFYCENNHYAISVPQRKQMATATIAERASAYGMPGRFVDGNDVLAVYATARESVEYALSGNGPVLIEANTYRLMPHTSNDNDLNYRTQEEIDSWRARDPIPRYQAYLAEMGLLDEAAAADLTARISEEVMAATDRALEAPDPDPRTALDHVFSPGTPYAPRLDPHHEIEKEEVAALRSEVGA